LRELAAAADRRVQTCLAELEETRGLLDQAERSRKLVEQELSDAADRIAELGASCSGLALVKKQGENSVAQLRSEYDEIVVELRGSEERVKRAASDAARLMEELRTEQEHSAQAEKVRRHLEVQVCGV